MVVPAAWLCLSISNSALDLHTSPSPLLTVLCQNAENEMAVIAAYYGLPTLSVRAATFHQMLRNQYGYRVRMWQDGPG